MMEREADNDGQRGVIINTASIAAYEGQVCCDAHTDPKCTLRSIPGNLDLVGSSVF